MRIFGSDRISGLMQKLGMEEGVPIEHGMVTRAIERAQKQVEAQNFSVRKHLLEYDDVMNKQRESVYALRRQLLEGKIQFDPEEGEEPRDPRQPRLPRSTWPRDCSRARSRRYARPGGRPRGARLRARLRTAVAEIYGLEPAELDAIELEGMSRTRWPTRCGSPIIAKYENKEQLVPADILRRVERDIMLQIVDAQWKDHLYSLDHLKEGIGLRGYGQRDPLVEYKKESYALFMAMKDRIDEEIVRYLWRLTPVLSEDGEASPPVPPPPGAAPSAADHDERPGQHSAAVTVRRVRQRLERPTPTRPPASGAGRRRRRDQAGQARRAEGRPQRSVPVRQRQEIQEMPWV